MRGMAMAAFFVAMLSGGIQTCRRHCVAALAPPPPPPLPPPLAATVARLAEKYGMPQSRMRDAVLRAHDVASGRQCSSRSAAPHVTTTSAAPLHVALLIIGSYDSSHGFGTPPHVVDLYRTHLVQGVLRLNPRNRVHTFLCPAGPQTIFVYRGHALNRTQPDWNPLRGPRSVVTEVDTRAAVEGGGNGHGNGAGDKVRGADPQYERIEACYLHARQRHAGRPIANQTGRGTTFTHYIRARFDLDVYAPLPAEAFDDERASIRARSLVLADECDSVHYHAVSQPAWKECGRYKLRHLPSAFPVDVDGPEAGVPSEHLRRWLLQLAGGGARFCYAADDMFAVVPTHLADSFFLRPGALEEHSLLPLGWDINRSSSSRAAAADTYGRMLDPAAYGELCAIPFTGGREACAYMGPSSRARCPPNTDAICDYLNRSNHRRVDSELCGSRTRPGSRVESRLTGRLHSRLVPVQFVPLPYRSHLYGGHGPECSREKIAALRTELAQCGGRAQCVGRVKRVLKYGCEAQVARRLC